MVRSLGTHFLSSACFFWIRSASARVLPLNLRLHTMQQRWVREWTLFKCSLSLQLTTIIQNIVNGIPYTSFPGVGKPNRSVQEFFTYSYRSGLCLVKGQASPIMLVRSTVSASALLHSLSSSNVRDRFRFGSGFLAPFEFLPFCRCDLSGCSLQGLASWFIKLAGFKHAFEVFGQCSRQWVRMPSWNQQDSAPRSQSTVRYHRYSERAHAHCIHTPIRREVLGFLMDRPILQFFHHLLEMWWTWAFGLSKNSPPVVRSSAVYRLC